ncbi:hypothetical protein SeMB42_g01753 [Synchytrium endobioticum]|uniref:TFIIS central domain-containing protein n=1 Tax=Synchytrium endobioticum TaxID=286115 RepID=A0A507DJX3_9FUNG|nr:hypothetical protein SeLEV6574_g04444 [Synchytrium endobioticum]TPX51952.1 hypothetical protein SeMB42_g01753 [Synchytrium endobioticum]
MPIDDVLRTRSRELLARSLNDGTAGRHPDRRMLTLSSELEAAIHAASAANPAPESAYKELVRSRAYNLKANMELRNGVLASQISPSRLASMTSAELANKNVKSLYDKIEAEVAKEIDISGQGLEPMSAADAESSLGHKAPMLLWSGGDADARIG